MPGFAEEGSVHHTNVVSPPNPGERRTCISAKFSCERILYVLAEMLILLSFLLCNAVPAASLLTAAENFTVCVVCLPLDEISGRRDSIDADPGKRFPSGSIF